MDISTLLGEMEACVTSIASSRTSILTDEPELHVKLNSIWLSAGPMLMTSLVTCAANTFPKD